MIAKILNANIIYAIFLEQSNLKKKLNITS